MGAGLRELTVAKNGPVKKPRRVIATDAMTMFGILETLLVVARLESCNWRR